MPDEIEKPESAPESPEESQAGPPATVVKEPKPSERRDSEEDDDETLVPPEIMKHLPPQVRAMMMLIQQHGPVPSPVLKQVNSTHITQTLNIQEIEAKNEHARYKWALGAIVGLIVVVFLFMSLWIRMLGNNPTLLDKILTGVLSLLIGVIGGGLGGYGYARGKRD